MPANGKVGPVVPPAGAAHWALFQCYSPGKQGRGTRYKKCEWPEPLADATVLDRFAAVDFSAQLVLSTWGPGKYRVDWYDDAGAQLLGTSRTFTVAAPREKEGKLKPPGRRRGRRVSSESDDDEIPTLEGIPVGSDGRLGLLEVFAMIRESETRANERAEMAAQRAREEANRAADRERQFLTQVLGMRGGAGGGGDPDTILREVKLSIREQMLGLREELGLKRAEEREREGEPEDPQNLEEGIERMGLSFLTELEQNTPGFIRENLPKFLEWVKTQANGRANGR